MYGQPSDGPLELAAANARFRRLAVRGASRAVLAGQPQSKRTVTLVHDAGKENHHDDRRSREQGAEALENYTQYKTIWANLG